MIAYRSWLDRSGPRFRVVKPGDEIPDDHPQAEWLRVTDAAGDDPMQSDEPTPKPAPAAPVPAPEVVPDEPAADRPRNAAPLAEWQKYAASQGIDPKGLSKSEIQAATR